MPINEPTDKSQLPPFLTPQPVVEFWDTGGTPQWRTFSVGRMYLDRLSVRTLNQGVSEALFRYECGEISFEGGQFAPVSPLSIDRTWLRVTITTDDTVIVNGKITPAPQTITWAGIVTRTEEINRASSGGARLITQRFTAKGMEWLLSRRQITTSEVGGADQVKFGLTFNAHSDSKLGRRTVKGNRSNLWGDSFAGDDRDAILWTGKDIVEYLITTQFPRGVWPAWGSDNLDLLKWIEPVLVCHGRSVFDVLAALVSPRRGLVSRVDYAAGGTVLAFGTFTYRADSMFTATTLLPSGKTIAANDTTVNLVTSTHRDAFTTINIDSSRRYDKVVATGARTGAVASFSIADLSVETGWLSKDQTSYRAGDPNINPAHDLSDQRDDHDRYRRQKFPQVFTEFVVPLNWKGVVGDGEGKGVTFAFPGQDLHVIQMRFSSYLPIKVGWDYQSVEPSPTVSAPDADQLRRPFVVFKIDDNKWEYGHELGDIEDETRGVNGYDFSCYTRPLDRRLGMSIKPTVGVGHVLATGVTTPIDDDTSDRLPAVDFNEMIITAYTQSHDHVSGEFPKGIVAAEHVHFLRLGDTAFLDFLPSGTVVDVLGGALVRARHDVFLRDDRKYLEDVARIAWQWYGFDRVSSQLRYKQITGGVRVGQLVGTIDDVSANAICSSVVWDFREQTTEIYTHFAEPDFAELGGR